MPVKTLIIDPRTGLQATVSGEQDEPSSLVVATRPLKTFNNRPFFFVTSEGSKDMNVVVTFGGTPEKIHDGIDSVLWTGSSIVGTKVTFDSGIQSHGGTKSIQVDNAAVGDVLQLAKGSDLDCNNYSAITLWVYVDKDWLAGDSITFYGWDTGAGAMVGNSINIEEYFDYSLLDTWQKIAISLDYFGDVATSTTLDAVRMQIVSSDGKSPKFYIDDIQFEESGAPVDFNVIPRGGTWLYLTSFDVIVVDEYDATLVNNSMPKIPYDGFLGVPTLTSGLVAKRTQFGKTMFSATLRDLIDFIGLPNTIIAGYGSDGTNTWVKTSQSMATPLILKSEDGDRFTYTVRDDLSGLKKFWISVACFEEERS